MKVIASGKTVIKKLAEKFTCEKCGCVFECLEDEYFEKESFVWGSAKTLLTCCPECHKIVEKIIPNSNTIDINSIAIKNPRTIDWSTTCGTSIGPAIITEDTCNVSSTTALNSVLTGKTDLCSTSAAKVKL